MSAVIIASVILSVINLVVLLRLAIGGRRALRSLNWRVQRLRSESQTANGKLRKLREELKGVTSRGRRNSKLLTSVVRSRKKDFDRLRDGQLELELLVGLSGLRLPHPLFLTGWAIDGFLAHRIVELLEDRRPTGILELGSGSSTVLIATLLERLKVPKGRHIAVDHLPEYLSRTDEALKRQQVTRQPELLLCPLSSPKGDSIPWYSGLEDRLGGSKLDLVIVDGPPGGDHPLSRFPALDAVRPFLNPGATVLLDDAKRPAEAEIVERWKAAYPELNVRIHDHGKGYAEFTVPTELP